MIKIKAIGFDWMGVVFMPSAKYHKLVSDFLGITEEKFASSYYKYNHLLNTKDTNPRDFWQLVFVDLGFIEKLDEFMNLLNNLPSGKYNDKILPLIKLLKHKKYKVGLFSNLQTEYIRQAKEIGVEKIFAVALFSAEVGVMKPDPASFLMLAEKLEVDISEMIFIDDTPRVLENAKTIGFEPILYTDMKSLLQRLLELDILTVSEIEKL